MAEEKYEKIIEANGFPNVFQQAMSDYYWLLENDYWLLNMIDYNQIIDSSWLFWLPEGNLINPEPSNEPILGPSVRGSFPVSPVAAFSRIFFRAPCNGMAGRFTDSTSEKDLVSWPPSNLKVKACGYILRTSKNQFKENTTKNRFNPGRRREITCIKNSMWQQMNQVPSYQARDPYPWPFGGINRINEGSLKLDGL